MQKQLEPIIEQMSKELGVPYDVCVDAYMSQWKFIKEKLRTFELKGMSIEQFRETKKNFNLPSIGKLCVTEKKFKGTLKAFEYIKKRREQNVQDKEDSSHVQHGDNNDE